MLRFARPMGVAFKTGLPNHIGYNEGERVLQRNTRLRLTFIRNFESLNDFSLLIQRPWESPPRGFHSNSGVDIIQEAAGHGRVSDSEHTLFRRKSAPEKKCEISM